MAPRQTLNGEQRRLLKITARMPLASVANLAPVLGLDEERVRRMLGRLRSGGWVASVLRGMTERRQHRFFLTRQGRGPALRHRPPAPQPQGGGPRLGPGRLPPRGRTARRTSGSGSPWTTITRPTWKGRADSPFATGGETGRPDVMASRVHGPRAPALDRHLPGRGDVPAPAGHAGAGLPPGPDLLKQRQGQLARRRYRRHQRGQDDRLPAAPPGRLLPRRGPLRRAGLDPLHLRRHSTPPSG